MVIVLVACTSDGIAPSTAAPAAETTVVPPSCDPTSRLAEPVGAYARAVLIDDSFYLVDAPNRGSVFLGEGTEDVFLGDFFYLNGSIFASLPVDDEDPARVTIADLVTGVPSEIVTAPVASGLLIGAAANRFLVRGWTTDGTTVLQAYEADGGNMAWEYELAAPRADEGFEPMAVRSIEINPAGTLLLVGSSTGEGLIFDVVVDATTGNDVIPPRRLASLRSELHEPSDVLLGWFDDNHVLYKRRDGTLFITDIGTLEREVIGNGPQGYRSVLATGSADDLLLVLPTGVFDVDVTSEERYQVLAPGCNPWFGPASPVELDNP
ncbi:MAG: hypothetical protein GY720_23235 [bacterium]|nr:hypothetical protein [bacterium]